jgi:SHS2 domain-containing protein
MSFSFFDHTGDIGVRLTGRTLDDLFLSAARAFSDSVTDPDRIRPRHSVSLALEASALDLLLVDWLSEILYRFEVEQFLVATAIVHVEGGSLDRAVPGATEVWRLRGTLNGEAFDRERHGIKVLIKAITYHALEVREDGDGWHATVVFDI